eukprot:gene13493-28615_t
MKRKQQSTLNHFVINKHSASSRTVTFKNDDQVDSTLSIFVDCPVCNKGIFHSLINDHLDRNCDEQKQPKKANDTEYPKELLIFCDVISRPLSYTIKTLPDLPGLYTIADFISVAEEENLINALDTDNSNPWILSHFNGTQQVKKWGLVTDYNQRKIRPHDESKGEYSFPPYLNYIIHRIDKLKIQGLEPLKAVNFIPNEGNAMSYTKNQQHYLKAHFDDRFLSGPILVNLSLGGDAIMTYRKEATLNPHICNVELPRRSLQIVSKQARYDYTHSIENSNIKGDRRVSVVLRQAGVS